MTFRAKKKWSHKTGDLLEQRKSGLIRQVTSSKRLYYFSIIEQGKGDLLIQVVA